MPRELTRRHKNAPPLLLAAACALSSAADVPPTKPGVPAAPGSRPALRRGGVLSSGEVDATAPVVEVEEEGVAQEETAEVDEPPKQNGVAAILQQVVLLACVLLFRFGLRFFQDRPSPFAGINTLLQNSPFGPLLRLVAQGQKAIGEFAQSPSSAPVMIGLLILATKLVARADSNAEAAAADAAQQADDEQLEADASTAESVEVEEVEVEEAEADEVEVEEVDLEEVEE